jgi:hypothetical protein
VVGSAPAPSPELFFSFLAESSATNPDPKFSVEKRLLPSANSFNIGPFLMAKIGVSPLVGIAGKRESAGEALCLAVGDRDAPGCVSTA